MPPCDGRGRGRRPGPRRCRPRSSRAAGRPRSSTTAQRSPARLSRSRADVSVSSSPTVERVLEVAVLDRRHGHLLEPAVGADEVGDERAGRVAQHGGRVVVLLEVAAGREHRDAVTEAHRLLDVVRHEQDRLAHLGLQPEELHLQPLARDRVDRAERLVHEQDRGIGGQRPSHADALALAAGELVRVAVTVRARRRGRPARAARRPVSWSCARSQPSRLGTVATFCRIVWWGNSPICWITYPIRRRSLTGSTLVTSSPSRKIRPLVGSTRRFTIFIVVVLPQPLGPTRTLSSPAATSRSSSCTATVPSG